MKFVLPLCLDFPLLLGFVLWVCADGLVRLPVHLLHLNKTETQQEKHNNCSVTEVFSHRHHLYQVVKYSLDTCTIMGTSLPLRHHRGVRTPTFLCNKQIQTGVISIFCIGANFENKQLSKVCHHIGHLKFEIDEN